MVTLKATLISQGGQFHRTVSKTQEKAELRSMVHEDVLAMTRARRQTIWERITREQPELTQEQVQSMVDQEQPEYMDYDPVVAMAVMSANTSYPVEVRLRAMAESAQYLRPKLKSIEMVVGDSETKAERDELASRLVGLLDAAAAAKRGTVIDGSSRPVDQARDESGDAQTEHDPAQDVPGGVDDRE